MYARLAAMYIHSLCQAKWPGEGPTQGMNMGSTMTNGAWIDVFDHKGYGTHKYIPADKLTADLEEPEGGGVYGYWKMADDSYLLLTCRGRLACWSGKPEDKAMWGDDMVKKEIVE